MSDNRPQQLEDWSSCFLSKFRIYGQYGDGSVHQDLKAHDLCKKDGTAVSVRYSIIGLVHSESQGYL